MPDPSANWESMLNGFSLGTLIVDRTGCVRSANSHASVVLVRRKEDLEGLRLADLLPSAPASPVKTMETHAINGRGEHVHVRLAADNYGEDDLLIVFEDLTSEDDEADDQLHDRLTDLRNRGAFLKDVADVEAYQDLAVLAIRLYNMRLINSAIGARAGDDVVKAAQRAIIEACHVEIRRKHVARVSGTTFAVLLLDADQATAMNTAVRIHDALDRQRPDSVPPLEASIGIRLTAESDERPTPRQLLSDAEHRADHARRERGRIGFAASTNPDSEAARLAADLFPALDAPQLYCVYQPVMKLDVDPPCVAGVEALIRWKRDHRIIKPGDYDYMSLVAGHFRRLSMRITRLVLDDALRLCQDCGYRLPVSVNVTSWDLADSRFVEMVEERLHHYGVPSARLKIEVLETDALSGRSDEVLKALIDRNISVAIDDVGRAHAGLKRIHDLPAAELKIDRSFLQNWETDVLNRLIVKHIVEIGRSSGRKVVAEGVDDPKTLEDLRQIGCPLGQGFLWCDPDQEPMTRQKVVEYLGSRWQLADDLG